MQVHAAEEVGVMSQTRVLFKGFSSAFDETELFKALILNAITGKPPIKATPWHLSTVKN